MLKKLQKLFQPEGTPWYVDLIFVLLPVALLGLCVIIALMVKSDPNPNAGPGFHDGSFPAGTAGTIVGSIILAEPVGMFAIGLIRLSNRFIVRKRVK
jgi:hypothetical protein